MLWNTQQCLFFKLKTFFFRDQFYFHTLKMASPMTMTFFTDCFALEHPFLAPLIFFAPGPPFRKAITENCALVKLKKSNLKHFLAFS